MDSRPKISDETFEEKDYKKQYSDSSNVKLINRIKMLELMLDSMDIPIFWKNKDFQIIGSNKAFKEYVGIDSEKYLGKTDAEITLWKSCSKEYRKYDEKVLCEGENVKIVEEILINNTEKRIIETIKSPIIENSKVVGISIMFKDITKEKKVEQELFKASYTDALTGLYNRAYFDKKITELDDKSNYPLTVAMIDVNGLKIMNDTFGHAVGDQALQKIGSILKDMLCCEAVVARIGGDEFAAIIPKVSLAEVEKRLEEISLEIHKTKVKNVKLSISYGCESKTSNEQDLNKIFAEADRLMYDRKRNELEDSYNNAAYVIMRNLYRLLPDETLHSKLVSKNCLAIAKKLNYDSEKLKKIANFASFHDIGKIAISKKLLYKTEPLTQEDWTILKRNPEVGYAILSSFDEYSEYANLLLSHCERYDGKGYPKGLKGDAIPEFSRILNVGDAIAAMESERAYRSALTKDEIICELEKNKGTQFDPYFAQIAIDLIKDGSLNVTKYGDEKFDLEDFSDLEY